MRQETATFGGSKSSRLLGLSRRYMLAACSALTFSILPVCSTRAQTSKTPSKTPQPSKNKASPPTQPTSNLNYQIITYIGAINNDGATYFSTDLANAIAANPTPEVIYIGIDSYGGENLAGMEMYNIIRACNIPIVTINLGYCESMAVALFLAGGVRIALPDSTFMLHSTHGHIDQDYDYNALNLKSAIEEIQIDQANVENIYKTRAHLSDAVIAQLRASDLDLNAWQAKDLNIATVVGNIPVPYENVHTVSESN